MLGRVLGGKYRITSALAHGGAGRVYRAMQEPMSRAVAVKVLRPELEPARRDQFEHRFLREASLAGALNHANVVVVHDYGCEPDGTCYIVMELIGGVSLKDVLRHGPLPPDRALDIFSQVTRGLRHAHSAGLVHRDIKPSNIMLVDDDDGRDFAKLLDFGLVKDQDDEDTSGITVEGTFMGTPHYVSPEQGRGLKADARSDIYSLGVVLYRTLTGVLPFSAGTPMAIAIAHIREPYPPMAERAPEVAVHPRLEAVVRKCMSKEPELRYQTADELLDALQAAWLTLSPAAPTVAPGSVRALEPPTPDPDPTESMIKTAGRSARWPLAVVAGGLAGILGVSLYGARQDDAWQDGGPSTEEAVAVSAPAVGDPVVAVRGDQPTPERTSTLPAPGFKEAQLALDMSADQATGHAALASAPRPQSAPAVRADGVSFTAEQAVSAMRFINEADESSLREAGITGRQVNIILEGRPFADLEAFARTPYIGEKTVERLKFASR